MPERMTRAAVETDLTRLAAAIGTPLRLTPGAGPGDGRRVRIETPWGRPLYDTAPHTVAETRAMIRFALDVLDHEHGPAFVAAQVDEYNRGYELSLRDIGERDADTLRAMLASLTELFRCPNNRGTYHHPDRAFYVGRFDGLVTEHKP